jgi:hypothetical protein
MTPRWVAAPQPEKKLSYGICAIGELPVCIFVNAIVTAFKTSHLSAEFKR